MRTTSPATRPGVDPVAHRRHLGVAALALWLAAIATVVLLWSAAGASGCVPPVFEGCAGEDVRR